MRVSYSRIKTARRCWKAHDYAYNQRLRRKAPPIPLLRGTILGECLDLLAQEKSYQGVLEAYAKKYKSLFREERETYGDIIGDCSRILSGYSKRWKASGLRYEVVEAKLFVSLIEGVDFVGYVDKVATDPQGRRWLLDHKSHRHLPSADQRASDIQSVFYYWAWNQVEPKRPADGFIWDYLRTKPPTRPELLKNGRLSERVNMDTDYDTYMATIQEHGLDSKEYLETLDRLKKAPSQFYQRVSLPNPNEALLESVVHDLKTDALLVRDLGDVLTSRNLSRDCPQCQFFSLCQAELRGGSSDFIRRKEYYAKEDDFR